MRFNGEMDKNTAMKGCVILVVLIVAFSALRNYCTCPPGLTEEQRERLLSEEVKEVKLREAIEALEEEEQFQQLEESMLDRKIEQLTEEKEHAATDTYCGVDEMILVSMKRSGTTFFCSLLSNHPQLKSLGIGQEILDGKHLNYYSSVFNRQFEKNSTIPPLVLEFMMAKAGVGFVLMGGQQIESINGQALLDLAQNRSVIHLVRQNVLRMYLSDLLAERVTSSHCYAGGDCKDFTGVKINIRTSILVKTLAMKEKVQEMNRQHLRDRKMKHIEIYYEELSADPVKVITQCLDFLQCSHLKPEQYVTNLVKRGASNLKDEIENFDEVVKTLKGTRFEHMIYDP